MLNEVFVNGYQADIWATGIFFAQLLLHNPQFMKSHSETELQQNLTLYLINKERIFCNLTKSSKELLFSMLELKPNKRINAKDALNHPYFSEKS